MNAAAASRFACTDGKIDPGIFYSMPMEDYLELPALSSGACDLMLSKCPKAAWFDSYLNPNRPRDDNNASDAGTIAHSIILEGSMAGVCVIDPEDHPAEKTGNIPEGWTNKSIRAARDEARKSGLTPVLLPAMREIEAMVDSANEFITSLRTTEPAVWAAFYAGGHSELTVVWNEGAQLCRMRPDRISADRKLIVHLKTTERSAEPDAFGRTFASMGLRVKAGFYRRGALAVFGVNPEQVFLVVEQNEPYLCSLVGMDPVQMALGVEQVDAAINEWDKCVASNTWPGYPARCCYPEPSAYEVAWWQERQAQRGYPYNVEQLFERTDE